MLLVEIGSACITAIIPTGLVALLLAENVTERTFVRVVLGTFVLIAGIAFTAMQ